MAKYTYPILGMHCASCKKLIEKMVGKVAGVHHVQVNYATETMMVEFDEARADFADIKAAVAKAGAYRVVETDEGPALAAPGRIQKPLMGGMQGSHHDHAAMLKQDAYNRLRKLVWWTGLGVLPFFGVMARMLLIAFGVLEKMHAPLGYATFSGGYRLNVFFLAQFALATPIVFFPDERFLPVHGLRCVRDPRIWTPSLRLAYLRRGRSQRWLPSCRARSVSGNRKCFLKLRRLSYFSYYSDGF